MKTTKNPLVGTWKTVSFEVIRLNNETHKPFGDHPQGQMIYTEDGRFSTQIAQPGRVQIKSGDMMDASHTELASNYRGFISYFGQYDYNEKDFTVLLHIEGSLFPNWENDTLKRMVKLSRDKLELTTEATFYGSEEVVGVVTWKRVK